MSLLRHLGLAEPDPSSFAARLPASRWYVQPFSLRSGTRLRDIWLFRPGIPCLIEVFEGSPAEGAAALVQGVDLPVPEGLQPLRAALGCEALRPASGLVPVLRTAASAFSVSELLGRR